MTRNQYTVACCFAYMFGASCGQVESRPGERVRDYEMESPTGGHEGAGAAGAVEGASAGQGGGLSMGGAGGQGDVQASSGGFGGGSAFGGNRGGGSTGSAGTGLAGANGGGGAGGNVTVPAVDLQPTVMAVGYGGSRVATQDHGVTWKKVAQLTRDGGDDRELLRAVAYGNGRWISAGWRMFTSGDGKTWVEGKNPTGCGLMEGAAFGNGVFVGTCGDESFLSDDGLTWRAGGRVGATNGHTYVLFGNGAFAASGDSGNSYTSVDGKTWKALSFRKVRFCTGQWRSEDACPGEAWYSNIFYKSGWKGKLERSLNGTSWATTYTDDWDNTAYRFGNGLMPPLK